MPMSLISLPSFTHVSESHVFILHIMFRVFRCTQWVEWRRQWLPTPVFLPGESQGRGSLVGCRLWGRIESDMTEAT